MVILLPTATHIHTKVKTKLIMSWSVVIIPTPFFSHDILAHHHAHHTRSDYKRPHGSEDIFCMKARNMARCAERRQTGRQMVRVIPLLPPTSLWGWGYKKKSNAICLHLSLLGMEPQRILLPCSSTSHASHRPMVPRWTVSSTTRMSSLWKSSSPSPSAARVKLARMKKWSPGMFCTLLYSEKNAQRSVMV